MHSGSTQDVAEQKRVLPDGKFAIEAHNLYKRYGEKKAVDGVSLGVLRGEIFGILGPNGAGKTTTMEMIEGLREPDANKETRIIVDGLDVGQRKQREELHQRIGLQLQAGTLFEELTVSETLHMLARLYRKARSVRELMKDFDLEEKARSRINVLSGGQKQRLALAAALVNDPTIVFLDEPTMALDPQARRNTWERIRSLQQAGKTIILTTHYMEEAEQLCDRVAVMDHGKIIALDTPARLINQHASEQSISCGVIQTVPTELLEALERIPGVTRVVPTSNGFKLNTQALTETLTALLPTLEQRQITLSEIMTYTSGLEDVYLNLTGKELCS